MLLTQSSPLSTIEASWGGHSRGLRLHPWNLIWVIPAKGMRLSHLIPHRPKPLYGGIDMKRYTCTLVLALILTPLALFSGAIKEQIAEPDELIVYAYDSFVSEWGPGPLVIPAFEQQTGIKVRLVSSGHGGELLSKLLLERNHPKADVVIGLESELAQKAIDSKLFLPYRSPMMDYVPTFLHFDPTYCLVPFNYGVYAFNYDSHTLKEIPSSLDDLLDPKWRKSIILIDPRTSNVGLGLLEWTVAIYGDDYLSWWENIKPNVLTITDGWSSAYGLFTEGEAPLVLSYTTSPVYHILYEESDRYKAIVFDEGNMSVIEGAAIVASTQKRAEAQLFIDFLLSDAQKDIAVANVMYPVNSNTVLPDAFDQLVQPKKELTLDSELVHAQRQTWIDRWVEVMSK